MESSSYYWNIFGLFFLFSPHQDNIGHRLLQKHGWKLGQGLGKTMQGKNLSLSHTHSHTRSLSLSLSLSLSVYLSLSLSLPPSLSLSPPFHMFINAVYSF